MGYKPTPPPSDPKDVPSYLDIELRRISQDLRDNADVVVYRTLPVNQGSLTAGVSANYKIARGNVIRVSTSTSQNFSGLAFIDPMREIVFLNVGTGSAVLTNADTASSASYRFAMVGNVTLAPGAAAICWYDPYSFRWRCLAHT